MKQKVRKQTQLIPMQTENENALIPWKKIEALTTSRNVANMGKPHESPKLIVNPSTLEALQRGLTAIASDREQFESELNNMAALLNRSEMVLSVYIKFVENIAKSKATAKEIRSAANHLLATMY